MDNPTYFLKDLVPEDGTLEILFYSGEPPLSEVATEGIDTIGWGMTPNSIYVKTVFKSQEDVSDGLVDFIVYRENDRTQYQDKLLQLSEQKEFLVELILPNWDFNRNLKRKNLVVGSFTWDGPDWDESNSLALGPDYKMIICSVFLDSLTVPKEISLLFREAK
jgi:hypothetical protein